MKNILIIFFVFSQITIGKSQSLDSTIQSEKKLSINSIIFELKPLLDWNDTSKLNDNNKVYFANMQYIENIAAKNYKLATGYKILIGNLQSKKKHYNSAIASYNEAINISKNHNFLDLELISSINLVNLLLTIKEYDIALITLKKLEDISKKFNEPINIINLSYGVIYTNLGDNDKALDYLVKYLNNINPESTFTKIPLINDDLITFDSVLISKNKSLNRVKKFTYTLLFFIICISFILYYTIKNRRKILILNKNLNDKTTQLEEGKIKIENLYSKLLESNIIMDKKNKEITDSIIYAKRIQSALLPPNKLFNNFFPNSFILYKPKDIVAGDFYWLETKNDKILFAVADCTGHGVPGAMVSVICNNGLNRSVREHGLTKPNEILNKTREIVIREFEKSDESVKDGMDIALCSLQLSKSSEVSESYATLQYAGANNSLWIIRQENNDFNLIEIKPDKQPIGYYEHENSFTNHSIELIKNDTIYIFTDGFVDQFGGDNNKKFKSSSFKKLLLSIQNKVLSEQKEIINTVFEKWRGENEQVDDVCVIGIRV